MDTLQDVFKGSVSKETDYLQYSIYLPEKEGMIAYLQDTLSMITSHVQPLIGDYIWQKDQFQLIIASTSDPSYPFLFGCSRFGDCISDEWFMISLLKQISLLLPESVIQLVDNDGDVLLIEAALVLPSWLDPSNSENRVYLHQGKVHIIPLPTSPRDLLQTPTSHWSRSKAISHIRSTKPLASQEIQQAIEDRCAEEHREVHNARCLLPNKAAFVLLSDPSLITLAVEAFYLRDPISLKACAHMNIFSPARTCETTVKLTKTSYAQTVSQKFYAPKPFRLPSIQQKKQFKYAELGMKVACGLEMLYSRSSTSHGSSDTVNEEDPKFIAYINHLTKLGYFREEKKGSQLYNALMKQAQEQFVIYRNQDTHKQLRVDLDDLDIEDPEILIGSVEHTVKSRIDSLLQQYSEEALDSLLESNDLEEDSDDWMNVDPQQLEELLMKRMGHMKQSMLSDLQQDMQLEEGMDLEAIMSNLENFVENKSSGVEGVVVSDDDEDEYDSEEEEEEEEEGAIQFDMDKFMSILKGTSHMEEAMQDMDDEINQHEKLANSFTKIEEENEDAPVDVQLNLVKNVLESFKSQQGLPGPVSNLLNQFGIVLPADSEETTL